jgi:hypothetical protein
VVNLIIVFFHIVAAHPLNRLEIAPRNFELDVRFFRNAEYNKMRTTKGGSALDAPFRDFARHFPDTPRLPFDQPEGSTACAGRTGQMIRLSPVSGVVSQLFFGVIYDYCSPKLAMFGWLRILVKDILGKCE